MRILVLTHSLHERGTYFRARETARWFHARGHDVTFVYTGEGYYRPRHGTRSRRWREIGSPCWTPLRERGDGWSPLGLAHRALELRRTWDLVYTFSHLPVDQGAARLLRGRCAFWLTDWCDLWNSREGGIHDTRHWSKPLPSFMRGLRGALTRASFAIEDALETQAVCSADATTIISTPMRVYTRRLGVPDANVLHYVSGCDTGRIPVLDPAVCRRELALPSDRPIIGYVANVSPDNRQLERAMQLVWKEFPRALLISVGSPWYHLRGPIARGVRNGRVRDFQRQPFERIKLFLGASDLVVMPLRDLPFNRCRWPHKFGDYLAAGRPTATCDVGDMGTVISEHGVGASGPPTADGLAAAMLELLRQPALSQQAGLRARALAEGELSWSAAGHRLGAFLNAKGLDV